jgi:6-phospho-3-hexuloisomerase
MVDLVVRIPCCTKLNLPDEIPSGQPMSSLFEQSLYLLCDIVCLCVIRRKDIDIKTLWDMHANLE